MEHVAGEQTRPIEDGKDGLGVVSALGSRVSAINDMVHATLEGEGPAIRTAVDLFEEWMVSGEIVRVVGSGRTRLALSIPASRLAHGGARVSISDGVVPMPNTSKGGAALAASSSGENLTVNNIVATCRRRAPNMRIVGIGPALGGSSFESSCDIFVRIHDNSSADGSLRVLGDWQEQVICILLDAMVAAAGCQAGFDDRFWRLGHEDLGSTGPHDQHSRPTENVIHG